MILLTGGSGFLGKHILRELVAGGYQVRVMCRNPEKVDWSEFGNVDIFKGDLLDPFAVFEALKGVKKVVHCAALVSFVKRERALMYRINAEGTANLVDACLELGVEKLVHISSIAAVGESPDGSPADEKAKWKPGKSVTHYARTKYRAEKEVYRGIAEGLEAVICNPGVIIGPGADNKTTHELFARLQKGMKYYVEGSNSYVGAKDCARAVKLLLETDLKAGERFILVSEILSYQKFLGMAAEKLGAKAPKSKAPKWLLRMAGPVVEFFSNISGKMPIISAETSRQVGNSFLYTGEKISRQLGFNYTPIEEVIGEIAQEFQAK